MFPPGNTRNLRVGEVGPLELEFVAAEELVLLALWAVRAFKAADK